MSMIVWDRLLSQPMQCQLGMPPAQMQLPATPQLMNYANLISSAVANEISMKATTNAIRTAIFNLASQNNWNNQYYADAVQLGGFMFLWTIQSSGEQMAINNILSIATKTVDMFIGKCIVMIPDFGQIATPDQIMSARQTYGQMEQLVGQMQGGGMQRPMQPMQQPMMAPPMYQAQIPQHSMMQQAQQPSVGFTGGFGQVGRPAMAVQGMASSDNDRYAGRQQQAQQIQQVHQPAQVIQTNKPEEKRMATPLQEVEMDRSQHTIVFNNGMVSLNRQAREYNACQRIDNLGRDLQPVRPEQLQVAVHPYTIIRGTLSELTLLCRGIQAQHKLDDKEAKIFRATGIVVDPFITADKYDERFREVTNSKDLKELASKLNVLYQYVGAQVGDAKVRGLVAVESLNRRLTKFINHFLRVEMDLKVSIDSISTDGDDLVNLITSNYPRSYEYLDDMMRVINSSFMLDLQDAAEEFRTDLVGDTGLGVTLLNESVSITLVDLLYAELGYKMERGVSYQVGPEQHLLHELARKVDYGDPAKRNAVSTHYLVTMDDVYLTLCKSLVNPTVMLVARV